MSPARLIPLLLLVCVAAPSFAEESRLGRLFFDPQQRARLDAQRQHNTGYQPNAGDSEGSQTINGEVRSSNGRRTRWINGEADWNGTAQPPSVPVGDTYNPATGERESVIGSGRITIRHDPPRP
jgi:hypothetical protein